MSLQELPTTSDDGLRPVGESETVLQGAVLVVARIAWVTIALLAAGLFVASLPGYFAYLHILNPASRGGPQLTPSDIITLRQLSLSLDVYAWVTVGVDLLILVGYVLAGGLLFRRASSDRIALLASFCLVLFPIVLYVSPGAPTPGWVVPIECLEILGTMCLGLFFCLFPSGRFYPRWTPWLLVVWTVYAAYTDFFRESTLSTSPLAGILFVALVGSLVAVQVSRYRRVSSPLERQQTKWVIFGIALAFGGYAIGVILIYLLLPAFFYLSPLASSLGNLAFSLLTLLFPLSVVIAILRYHLWDIDTLVNRTLVYGALTISLGSIYIGLIIGLESADGAITGTASRPIALVISTLMIAALFQPLRSRLQGLIDRRFYRGKYDAEKTLAAFTATLRSEVDLVQIHDRLLAVVEETIQPAHISLWLRQPERHLTDQAYRMEPHSQLPTQPDTD